VFLDDAFPFLLPLGLAVGKHDGAGFVFHGFEQHLDRLADLGQLRLVEPFFLPLLDRDDPLALVADVDDDLIADDGQDVPGDDLVDFEVLGFLVERLDDLLLEEVFELAAQLGFLGVELAKEVAINHKKRVSLRPHPPALPADGTWRKSNSSAPPANTASNLEQRKP
jgi:hypothetical protein